MSTPAPRPTRHRRARVTLATLVALTAIGGGTVAAHAAVTPTSSSSSSGTGSTAAPAAPTTGTPTTGTATPPAPPAPGSAPAAPPADGLAHGDVTAVSGDSLTITGPEGEKTFTLDGSTTVEREQGPGDTSAASASDLAVGEHVHVEAVDDAADPLVAATVTIMPTPPAPGTAPTPPADGAPAGPRADGLVHGDVTAVTDDSLTLTSPEGEKTITLDGSTVVQREQGPGNTSAASASDLAVGEHVHVKAVDDAADPLVAATVTIMPTPPAPGTGPTPPADGTALTPPAGAPAPGAGTGTAPTPPATGSTATPSASAGA